MPAFVVDLPEFKVFSGIHYIMSSTATIDYPLLVTDASSPGAQAGVLVDGQWASFAKLEGEASKVLFTAVETVLEEAGLTLNDIRGFAYCEGPGSTLGIRINSMAIRTWNSLMNTPMPIFSYRSLNACAASVEYQEPTDTSYAIFSDLRKNIWNALRVNEDSETGELEIVEAKDLGNWPKPRYYIQQRLFSPGKPEGSEALDYSIESLGAENRLIDLLRKVETPEVLQTTETTFKKWVPARHK